MMVTIDHYHLELEIGSNQHYVMEKGTERIPPHIKKILVISDLTIPTI